MNRLVSCLAFLMIIGGSVQAEGSAPCSGAPPPGPYSLPDVTLECKRVGGWGGQTAITLSGRGTGVKLKSGEQSNAQAARFEFVLDPKVVFDLLRRCYEENFFSFLDSYQHPQSLRIGVGGQIVFTGESIFDATFYSVSVRIGAYSKTVSYFPEYGRPPAVLSEICKRIEELSSRPVPQ